MSDNEQDASLFDAWTRDYALLGLRMERLAPGTVDAWIGPQSWRAGVEADELPTPDELRGAADDLLARLPAMGYRVERQGYLEKQVQALGAQARVLGGEQMSLREQARLYFDIYPEPVSEDLFAAAHAELERLLPGDGSLQERRAAWRKRFQVSPDQVLPLLPKIEALVRQRTLSHFPLPDGEGIELKLTSNQPWGAYNWYLGDYRSLIELNTDLPTQVDGLVGYLCHEGYPGHHTEHATREAVQYRARGEGEYAIQLINTPESLISEAIATSAQELILSDQEALAWTAHEIMPALGLAMDPELARRIADASAQLRYVSGNAAFKLHEDGASTDEVVAYLERWALRSHTEAVHHLGFLNSPLWRVYTFTYSSGYDLFKPLLAGPDRYDRFAHIISNPVYPSLLAGN